MKTKIRLIKKNEISILYDHLKEFLDTPNASTTGSHLPKFENSSEKMFKASLLQIRK